MINKLTINCVKIYAAVYGVFKDAFNINIPGLGFMIRRIKTDCILEVYGRKIYFNRLVSGAYGRHFSGNWNEPETHIFLNSIIKSLKNEVIFVDVGANIGEMVIDVARNANVVGIYAYEPIPECATSIRKSCELNLIKNCKVIEMLVGNKQELVSFSVSQDISDSSAHFNEKFSNNIHKIEMTTLDVSLANIDKALIILIDVEGMELEVMRGAISLINRLAPLIIFEYNYVSKRHYHITEIQDNLGPDWQIYRLRADARLDKNIEDAWNCVAFHRKSTFSELANAMLLA